MLKYTNGYGHLIMSIVVILVGLILIVLPTATAEIRAVGVGMLTTVIGAWFVPGAAQQVATQVATQTAEVTKEVVSQSLKEGSDGKTI